MLAGQAVRSRLVDQRRVLLLAGPHGRHRVVLQLDHFGRRERAARRVWGPVDTDEVAGVHPVLELRLDVPNRDLAHRSREGVAEQVALADDRLAFEIPVLRIRHGGLRANPWRLPLEVMGTHTGRLHYVRRLIAKGGRNLLVAVLHVVVRVVKLRFARVVGRDLGGSGPSLLFLRQMFLDLPAAWARGLEILRRVTADLRLPALAAVDLIAQLSQVRRQLRTVDGGRILLRSIELPRLEGVGLALIGFREIEEHGVGMQLRRRVVVDRSGAIVLKRRGDPPARGLGGMIAADARLDVLLEFVERDLDAGPVRLSDTLIAANQRRERDTLGCGERRVPAGAMLHRLHAVAVRVRVRTCGLMAHERLIGNRMTALGESLEVRLIHLTGEPPFARELTMPVAMNLVAGGVVVVARVPKLLGVVPLRLCRAERLRDRQHADVHYFQWGSRARSIGSPNGAGSGGGVPLTTRGTPVAGQTCRRA